MGSNDTQDFSSDRNDVMANKIERVKNNKVVIFADTKPKTLKQLIEELLNKLKKDK